VLGAPAIPQDGGSSPAAGYRWRTGCSSVEISGIEGCVKHWAGWGAGPSGAGAMLPSRLFLALALAGAVAVAAVLYRDGKRVEALVALAAAIYFALRLFGGLGRRRDS